LPSLYTTLKDVFILPQLKYVLFKLGKIHLAIHWRKHNKNLFYNKTKPRPDLP
jgi:hypothetical protein